MMIGTIVGIIAMLASLTVIDRAVAAGFLNGSLTRGVVGGSVAITSQSFLYGYTNLESFINACASGVVGLAGYAFLASLALLAAVWINNLIQTRQAIL